MSARQRHSAMSRTWDLTGAMDLRASVQRCGETVPWRQEGRRVLTSTIWCMVHSHFVSNLPREKRERENGGGGGREERKGENVGTLGLTERMGERPRERDGGMSRGRQVGWGGLEVKEIFSS
jgi:hypothetical protein